MRSPFPAHSPSGHGVGDCWCQDPATGPTLIAAVALVEHWAEPAWRNALAYERSHAPDGTVPARMVELIGALAAAVHGETP